MTVELNETSLCDVIEGALKAASSTQAVSQSVSMSSKMGVPREWDSLSFVAVFTAVGDAFDVELDDDDAINFQTAAGIFEFLNEVLNE